MNIDVEFHIRHNYPWCKLPANMRQRLGNSQREYEKQAVLYSIYEHRYYEELLKYSQDHLMLYPYHLLDIMVKVLRITPFSYYTGIMEDIMNNEKSYNSLLLGIGRNQYIDLMNQCRSSKKFFRRKTAIAWLVVQAGYITEDDIKICILPEKFTIDKIIHSGPQLSGSLDYNVVYIGHCRWYVNQHSSV
uniref:FAM91 N-terminal domain-containing protein n=1 Tax=Cebus imitator TaxID=2715852 RepID=A0A2K5SIS2_CEBIM